MNKQKEFDILLIEMLFATMIYLILPERIKLTYILVILGLFIVAAIWQILTDIKAKYEA